jgi:molybdopterin adenylyltransferase
VAAVNAALPDDARAVVVTASNRASAGVYADRSGQALAEGLRALGFTVEGPHVRPDDAAELEVVLLEAIGSGADVVVTTGGTGLSPTDVTPEATRRVLDREAPGIAEAVRRYGEARCRPRCCPAGSPAPPGARWSSTCPAPPAVCGTASPSSARCSPTWSRNCAAATMPDVVLRTTPRPGAVPRLR